MGKIILMIAFTFLSNNTMAEWTRINSNDERTEYIDLATIRENGYRIRIWQLTDYKKVQKNDEFGKKDNRYLSANSRMEYDCKEEHMRVLDLLFFSGNMGMENLVYSQTSPRRLSENKPLERVVPKPDKPEPKRVN